MAFCDGCRDTKDKVYVLIGTSIKVCPDCRETYSSKYGYTNEAGVEQVRVCHTQTGEVCEGDIDRIQNHIRKRTEAGTPKEHWILLWPSKKMQRWLNKLQGGCFVWG
jgi:hypothetical protein